MSRALRNTAFAWWLLPLHVAVALVPASGVFVCVGPGHFDIEPPHAGLPCHGGHHQAAPKRGCIDIAVVGALAERPTVAVPTLRPERVALGVVDLVSSERLGASVIGIAPVGWSPAERPSLIGLRTVVLRT